MKSQNLGAENTLYIFYLDLPSDALVSPKSVTGDYLASDCTFPMRGYSSLNILATFHSTLVKNNFEHN